MILTHRGLVLYATAQLIGTRFPWTIWREVPRTVNMIDFGEKVAVDAWPVVRALGSSSRTHRQAPRPDGTSPGRWTVARKRDGPGLLKGRDNQLSRHELPRVAFSTGFNSGDPVAAAPGRTDVVRGCAKLRASSAATGHWPIDDGSMTGMGSRESVGDRSPRSDARSKPTWRHRPGRAYGLGFGSVATRARMTA